MCGMKPYDKMLNMNKNAEKQKRFRDKRKNLGRKELRAYVNTTTIESYSELSKVTGWSDTELVNNALRLTYAAYHCGQIKLLNEWLKEHKR